MTNDNQRCIELLEQVGQLRAEIERLRAEDEVSYALLTDAKAENERLHEVLREIADKPATLEHKIDLARRAREGK